MTQRQTAIPDDVLTILKRSAIDGHILKLPGQLDRPIYERVDKVLRALGGKWNRKAKGHAFAFNPRELLGEAIDVGAYIDRKKALQFFETPAAVARRMIELARLSGAERILEPEAGLGAILRAIETDNVWVTAVEIDEQNFRHLLGLNPPYRLEVVNAEFLAWAKSTDERFDVVLMNPPFSDHQDIAHIKAAWALLNRGGRLVAVCGEGAFFREQRVDREFRDWLFEIGAEDEKLPPGTFSESGTEVASRIISVTKHGAQR